MSKLYAGLAVTAVAGMAAAFLFWTQYDRNSDEVAQCRGGAVADETIGGPFTLVDQTGATVTDKQVITTPSLVYFGYTSCPDVCPIDNARNSETVDILEEMGLEATPVFISVDPARDTPEVLAEYAARLHPRMIALTGTAAQVKAASQAYQGYFRQRAAESNDYLVDHSALTYLMLPGTGLADVFERELTADQLALKVACFLGS